MARCQQVTLGLREYIRELYFPLNSSVNLKLLKKKNLMIKNNLIILIIICLFSTDLRVLYIFRIQEFSSILHIFNPIYILGVGKKKKYIWLANIFSHSAGSTFHVVDLDIQS